MDNKIYEIWSYVVIGKTFYTYKERPDLSIVDEKRPIFKDQHGKIIHGSDSHYYSLSIGLSNFPKEFLFDSSAQYFPYFADVREDLPAWAKWEPKVHKNCRLTTQKPGGYLVFENQETGEELKIAMNSHVYHPVS